MSRKTTQKGASPTSPAGDELLDVGRKPGERRRAPVLVFGRWRLEMSDEQAARLERAIVAHADEHGSPFGFVARLLRAMGEG